MIHGRPPDDVTHDIDKLINLFIWGGHHAISVKQTQSLYSLGGLNIPKTERFWLTFSLHNAFSCSDNVSYHLDHLDLFL